MISEARGDCGILSATGRRAEALYPRLRPGPHGPAGEGVESNQRARLYGAMIELVAARGYGAGTVAELCALAGVSKRTLYERFPGGREECFLATYDIVVHRAKLRVLDAAQRRLDVRAGVGRLARLRSVAETFAREVAAYPNAARLVAVEAFEAGPAALGRTVRTARLAERVVAASLREDLAASVPPPRVVRAIVSDGAQVLRARLLHGSPTELERELPELCAAGLGATELETIPCIRTGDRLQ